MTSAFSKARSSKAPLLRAYAALIAPRAVLAALLLGAGGLMAAADGRLPLVKLALLALGGGLAAAGASVLNGGARRAAGRIAAADRLIFGGGLVAWAVLVLGGAVNWLTAGLALLGALYYGFLHPLLGRHSPVIGILSGGAAAGLAVLVGWAGAHASLTLPALGLSALTFYWAVPRGLARRLAGQRDDAAVRREKAARHQVLFYALQMVIVALLLLLPQNAGRAGGTFYLLAGLVLGGGFIASALWLLRAADRAAARRFCRTADGCLCLMFLALAADRLLL